MSLQPHASSLKTNHRIGRYKHEQHLPGRYIEPCSIQNCMRSVRLRSLLDSNAAHFKHTFLCIYLPLPCGSLPSWQTSPDSRRLAPVLLELFWLQQTFIYYSHRFVFLPILISALMLHFVSQSLLFLTEQTTTLFSVDWK